MISLSTSWRGARLRKAFQVCSSRAVSRSRRASISLTWLSVSLRARLRAAAVPPVDSRAATRDGLEVPGLGHRGGELDVAHALAPHLGARHLHAAALADDALEADPLVLAAVALPVLGRTEDALVEEAVLLRLQGSVVDGLR